MEAPLMLLLTFAALAARASSNPLPSPVEDVGFFAYYSNVNEVSVPVNNIIKFNVAETNLGNAYDVTTGIFTAPSDGHYFFSLFTQAGNANSNMGIYVKGVATCGTGNNRWDQSGCTAFVSLSRGDRVSVMAQGHAARFVARHADTGARTGFSGFRYQTNATRPKLEAFQERFNLYQANLMQELDSYRTNLRQENEEYKAKADEALEKANEAMQLVNQILEGKNTREALMFSLVTQFNAMQETMFRLHGRDVQLDPIE